MFLIGRRSRSFLSNFLVFMIIMLLAYVFILKEQGEKISVKSTNIPSPTTTISVNKIKTGNESYISNNSENYNVTTSALGYSQFVAQYISRSPKIAKGAVNERKRAAVVKPKLKQKGVKSIPNKATTGNKSNPAITQTPSKDEMLAKLRSVAVDKQRIAVKKEMAGYEYDYENRGNLTLENLVMENGGRPIINVICTTWRSGSTFLGAAVASHPGTFYHYEPLEHFGIKQVRSGDLAREGLRVINNQLNCNFTNLKEYMDYGKTHRWLFDLNERVWQHCRKNEKVCNDAKFMSDMCRMFPFQLMKTVRFRLNLAKELLENDDFDIRLLLLVRDPRGTMQSRNHRSWCPQDPDCYDPGMLCKDMTDDFAEAKLLREEYPSRFLSIRYEDVSLNPYEAVQKILKFFRLQYHPKVKTFLDKHTKQTSGGVSSTFRDSKNTPFHWREDFVGNFSMVENIQKKCVDAMKLWGYERVEEPNNLLTFNPLKEPPFEEMLLVTNPPPT